MLNNTVARRNFARARDYTSVRHLRGACPSPQNRDAASWRKFYPRFSRRRELWYSFETVNTAGRGTKYKLDLLSVRDIIKFGQPVLPFRTKFKSLPLPRAHSLYLSLFPCLAPARPIKNEGEDIGAR